MARVKVQLADNIKRVVFVDPDATIGATIGTDLKMPDGSIATAASLAAYLGISTTTTTPAHRLLAGLTVGDDHPQYTRKDTLTTRGDLYVRDATTVARLAIGSASKFLQSNGTDPAWQTISPVITLGADLTGSVTLTNLTDGTLAATIASHAVTNSKFRQSSALTVVGNSTNATADVADIAAGSDHTVLQRSGTSLTFAQVNLTNTVTGTLPVANGGSGAATLTGYLKGNGTSAFTASSTIPYTDISGTPSIPAAANPTASVGLTAVNGVASTYMRSDGAPALDVSISPTWSGTHTFNNTPTVPAQSWTYAKIQNVSATSRILGRITAGAGTMEELTGTQVTTLLDAFTSSLKGLAPASGGGTTNFLRADGTWAAPGAGTPANPTANVGLTAVNGSASTYMRSDAAPALDVSIAPTWTGAHTFTPSSSVVAVTINAAAGLNGLQVTGSTTGGIATFTGGNAGHTAITIKASATTTATLGDRSAVTGGTSGSFAIGALGSVVLATGGSSNERLVIDGFGAATLNAPSSGTGLSLNSSGGTTAALDLVTGSLKIAGSAGTSGQVLVSQGNSAPIWSNNTANPTASIGLTAVNGSAITFMRSDAAPALDVSIAPTWTAGHIFAKNASSPPSVGQAISVSAVTNGVAAVFYGPTTGAQGFNFDFYDTTNSVYRGFIGFGTSTATGAAVTDFGISPGASGSVVIGTANGGAIGTRFGPNGNVTISSPSSGTALAINQLASANAISVTDGTISVQHIVGSGAYFVGTTSAHGIKFETSGNSRLEIDSSGAVLARSTFAINSGTPTAQPTGYGSPSGSPTSGLTSSATLAQTAGTLAALLSYLKTIGFIGA